MFAVALPQHLGGNGCSLPILTSKSIATRRVQCCYFQLQQLPANTAAVEWHSLLMQEWARWSCSHAQSAKPPQWSKAHASALDHVYAQRLISWAAWYNTWLLIKLTPKDVVSSFSFSFLFFFFSFYMHRAFAGWRWCIITHTPATEHVHQLICGSCLHHSAAWTKKWTSRLESSKISGISFFLLF